MGLDFLDLTYQIEETFGIELSQDDLRRAVRNGDMRVGDLYELILRKLGLSDGVRNDFTLNTFAWKETRRMLLNSVHRPAAEIELSTPLDMLFPRETRRRAWSDLRHNSPYRIPDLDYPLAIRGLGIALALATVATELLHVGQIPGAEWFWPVLGLIGLWMVGETYLKLLPLFARFRLRFPPALRTVKDLCRIILAANYEDLCINANVAYDDRCLAVWNALQRILAEILDVEHTAISFRSNLIRDLGMQ